MKLHPEKYTTTTEAPSSNETDDTMMMDPHSRIDFNYNGLKFINGKQNYYDMINKHNYYYKQSPSHNKISDKSDNFAEHKTANQSKNGDSIWTKFVGKYVI